MKSFVGITIPVITFLLLAAVGLDLTRADFVRVRRQPRLVAAGLLGPLVLLPPVALALHHVFEPPWVLSAGLLLIAACPIGGISNTYSLLAGAATALSVTLTAGSCVLAVVTLPAQTRLFETLLGRPLGFSAPVGALLAQLLFMLTLPVATGMFVRSRWPGLAERHSLGLRRLAAWGLGLLIVIVIWDQQALFRSALLGTARLAACFVLLSFVVGWAMGGLLRAEPRERFTLAMEFATRNVAIATAVAVTLLGRIEFAVFATTYFLTELPLALLAVTVFRRGQARAAARGVVTA